MTFWGGQTHCYTHFMWFMWFLTGWEVLRRVKTLSIIRYCGAVCTFAQAHIGIIRNNNLWHLGINQFPFTFGLNENNNLYSKSAEICSFLIFTGSRNWAVGLQVGKNESNKDECQFTNALMNSQNVHAQVLFWEDSFSKIQIYQRPFWSPAKPRLLPLFPVSLHILIVFHLDSDECVNTISTAKKD